MEIDELEKQIERLWEAVAQLQQEMNDLKTRRF